MDLNEMILKYEAIKRKMKRLEIAESAIKNAVRASMGNEKKITVELNNGHIWTCLVVSGYNRENIDKAKVKEILGDAQYKKCVSISPVNESFRITADKDSLL